MENVIANRSVKVACVKGTIKVFRANQLLQLLTDILTDDASSKSHIKADYGKFKPKMTDGDARLFAAVSFLRRFIDDTLDSGK